MIPPITKTYPLEDRRAILAELGDLIDAALIGQDAWIERPGSSERMLLALWARAHGTYGAIDRLAEDQDGDSAAMLSRVIFETMIDAYWIREHRIKAQELAVQHYRLLQLVTAEHYNPRLLPGDPRFPIDPATVAERAALASRFGSKAQKPWTMLDLRARIHAVSAQVPQDFGGELVDRYDEDNRLANLLLHGSPMALNDRVVDTGNRVTITVGPTGQHLGNALRHTYWSYYRLGLLMVELRAPEQIAGLNEAYRNGWPRLQTLTAGALKVVGRNGPCPCGSGLKTKDCHGRY